MDRIAVDRLGKLYLSTFTGFRLFAVSGGIINDLVGSGLQQGFPGDGGFAPAAFAYLDPSTGSMILSAIVGVLATAGLVIKNYWYKLKSFFRGGKQTRPDPVTESASVADTKSESE